ncbi:melatonin receptor type 1A-like [Dendronephthya gigantea]|uniref:melatonin receptor type 1A-like n=1 Tax=Dendronephthya gigantea TaxID=151771 RepID=UPI00106C9181|nr:melatonin receptor type 1A-like [Dendronephthya gigantea]
MTPDSSKCLNKSLPSCIFGFADCGTLQRYIRSRTSSSESRLLILVLLIILSAAASTGHILVIVAIYQRNELRGGTYLIILNLSIADLLYAAIFLPLEARDLFPPSFSSCETRGVLGTLSVIASINMLTFVSIERFMATNYPFKHRQWFTTKLILVIVALIWLWCVVFAIYPFFTSGYDHDYKFLHCTVKWRSDKVNIILFVLFHGLFPSVALIYCNLKIMQAVRNRSSVASSASSTGTFRMRREKRVTKTVIIVILAVLICFLPYSSILYCLAITDSCEFPPEYVALSLWLIRCNCSLNPIIYGLLNTKFRSAFKEILCSHFSKRGRN